MPSWSRDLAWSSNVSVTSRLLLGFSRSFDPTSMLPLPKFDQESRVNEFCWDAIRHYTYQVILFIVTFRILWAIWIICCLTSKGISIIKIRQSYIHNADLITGKTVFISRQDPVCFITLCILFTVSHRRRVTAVTRLPRWRRRKTRLQARPLLTML